MKLTEHFTLEELIASSTAKAKGIDNTPNEEEQAHLLQLCQQILEPIRKIYGQPIKVTSAFRCKKLNTAVGGAKTSQHLTGCAADIKATKTTNAVLFHCIKQLIEQKKIFVGQLIWEYGTKNEPNWVHVSMPRVGKPNNQILYLYKK